MWHPWRALREREHLTLRWRDTDEYLGRLDHSHGLIDMATGMLQCERRCTVSHELIHDERGPAVPGYEAWEEAVVRQENAERLISTEELIEAMLWSQDEFEIADQCWVDVPTVRDRLKMMTAAERRHIQAELDRRWAEVL